MNWETRLREAAYTPPGGERLTFTYEDVSNEIELRGTAFEFPDANGTYVQRTGNSGRRYPMRVHIWGDNYDLDADAFVAALEVAGTGTLEHPIYGTLDVVPFGKVARRDALKTAANEAVIEVVFWETIGVNYPTSQNDPGSDVVTAVDEYNNAKADEFNLVASLGKAVEQADFKNRYDTVLGVVSDALKPIADTTDEVRTQFEAIERSINTGIDVLVQDPLTLAFQTSILLEAPSRAAASISDRLSAYRNLADALISGDGAVRTPGIDAKNSNEFHNDDLFASTFVAGSVLSVVNNQFQTRSGALQAAEELLGLMDDVTKWRDDNYASLGQIDTGGSYQQLQEAVALAAGFLVEISFTLKQEKTIFTTRRRTMVDLCAELYQAVDNDTLDFFVSSNNLGWQELIEIPKGRRIVYYV